MLASCESVLPSFDSPGPTAERHVAWKLLLQNGPCLSNDGLHHLRSCWQIVDEAYTLPSDQREVIPMIFGDGLSVDVAGDEILPRKGQDGRSRAPVAFEKRGTEDARVSPGKGIGDARVLPRFLE